MMWSHVENYNKRRLDTKVEEGSGFFHFLFGFKENERPSMVAAYLLWFFFGFAGVHRWYTGHCTPASYCGWLLSGQIFGLGWLYDGYHTIHLVNHYKTPSKTPPFYVKVLDGKHDYMPVNSAEQLQQAFNKSFLKEDKTLCLIIVDRKQDSIAYTLWLLFGFLGAHAWYLGLNPSTYIPRLFTGNYFGIGWIVEGIRLDDLIEEANEKLAEQFVPNNKGRKHWPLTNVVVSV